MGRTTLPTETARQMAQARKHKRGGRPRIPTICPRCGKLCNSATRALAHCMK